MAYGIYLALDQDRWARGNYSSGNKLTGTIYSDKLKTTAFDLTGYTLIIRIFKRWNNTDLFNKTATIVTAASGTYSYAVAIHEMTTAPGVYLMSVEIAKSGEVMSTMPEEFTITENPI